MSAAQPRKQRQPLPELRPLDRRPARTRRCTEEGYAVAAGEERQQPQQQPKYEGPVACFTGPLFGGCTICTVHEDDVVRSANARPAMGRLHENWETEVFCSARQRQACGAKVEELVEELEDEEEDSTSDKDEGRGRSRASASMPPVQRLEARFLHSARGVDEGQDGSLQRAIEAVMWNCGDVFVTKGWELTHKSGDRYCLNGRGVKLSLLRLGVPLPSLTHLLKVLDYETAERAARITVCDGPLQQPLMDYLMQTGQNERYDERGTENIAGVTGAAKMLDFNIAPTSDRILEMRSAMIQADMRRSVGGEFERVSALQSEGVKLLGGRPPGGSVILGREKAGAHESRASSKAAAS